MPNKNRKQTAPALLTLLLAAFAAVLPARAEAPTLFPVGSRREVLALAREEHAQGDVKKGAQTMIVGAILATIGIVIGLVMYPIAADAANTAATDNSTQERDIPLILLLPTLLILLLVLAGVGVMFVGFQTIKG